MARKAPRRTAERILEASLALFNRFGESHVSTAAIAADLGISSGNLYYHYRAKDEIVNALFAQYQQALAQRLQGGDDVADVEDAWRFTHRLFELLWQYRFLYRDLNHLLSRNRQLEAQFPALLQAKTQAMHALLATLEEHERQGRSITLLAGGGAVHAWFAVADPLRAHVPQAIAQLRALGVQPMVLSGDNPATVQAIALEAGISAEDARGGLLPEDKLAALAELQHRHGPTAMTGDGINDAPALARADLGFAMGGAHSTAMAMETAGVVLMHDDLRRIPDTLRLAQKTHRVLWQNISLALGVKAVFFMLALLGLATMWLAVLADMGVSLLVVANGLRLRHALPATSDQPRP